MSGGMMGQFGRFIRCQHGSPAIEFAFLAPVLVLMAIGTIDFGLAFRAKSQTEAAARAAMQKGMACMWDNTGMLAAARDTISTDATVKNATNLTAVQQCFCDGTLDSTAPTCTNDRRCGGGGVPVYYTTVTVTRPYSLMLDYFVIPNPMTLTADVTFRSQPVEKCN